MLEIDGGGSLSDDSHFRCRDCGVHVCHYQTPEAGDCQINEPHVRTCMYGAIPNIVAALEAAERSLPILTDVCPPAGCERWNLHGLHDDDCVIGHLSGQERNGGNQIWNVRKRREINFPTLSFATRGISLRF